MLARLRHHQVHGVKVGGSCADVCPVHECIHDARQYFIDQDGVHRCSVTYRNAGWALFTRKRVPEKYESDLRS